MKTILVLAEKGGVGKTMLADEITFSLERSRIPVAFFEMDRQGGELHTLPPIEYKPGCDAAKHMIKAVNRIRELIGYPAEMERGRKNKA